MLKLNKILNTVKRLLESPQIMEEGKTATLLRRAVRPQISETHVEWFDKTYNTRYH